MYYGVKTGFNKAFVIDQATRDRLIAEHSRSAEVIKPFLRGRDIERYIIHNPNLFLLYIGWRCKITEYPAVLAHLEQFHEQLAARPETKQGRVPWFALSRYAADYSAEFDLPKIVYPDIAMQAEFAWDTNYSYIANTAYCIPSPKRFLCAFLNSRLIEYIFASLSPQIRGGFFRFIAQYMEQLPIVEPSQEDQVRLVELVDQLQAMGGQIPESITLEREMDAIVYRTYDLTEEEIAEIERWHVERRAQLSTGRRGQQIVADEEVEA